MKKRTKRKELIRNITYSIKNEFLLDRIDHRIIKQTERLEGKKASPNQISELAERYISHMAADYNEFYYRLFITTAHIKYHNLLKNIFIEEASFGAIEKTRKISKENPVIFLPNHVSDADPLVLGWAFYKNNIKQPFFNAGTNLFEGGSKSMLPRLGAYSFDRRKAEQGDLFYFYVHKKYVEYILTELGEDLAVFIQGGRSYDGSLRYNIPKRGVIGDVIDIQTAKQSKNIYLAKVSLAYTIVPEDMQLAEAYRLNKKIPPEDLIANLDRYKRAYRDFDNVPIYVTFHEPVLLRHYIRDAGLKKGFFEKIARKITDSKHLKSDIADRIIDEIGAEIKVFPNNVFANAVLAEYGRNNEFREQKIINLENIKNDFPLLIDHLKNRNLEKTPIEKKPEDIIDSALNYYKQRGIIDRENRIANPDIIWQDANRILHLF